MPTDTDAPSAPPMGSGARYNTGKPRFDLVPLHIIVDTLEGDTNVAESVALRTLRVLGGFQRRNVTAHTLVLAIEELGTDCWVECANVFAYGEQKYSTWNWAKGMAWSAVIGSCARHLLAMIMGDENDAESGLPHRGHVCCNLVMLITYEKTFPQGDDRAPEGFL